MFGRYGMSLLGVCCVLAIMCPKHGQARSEAELIEQVLAGVTPNARPVKDISTAIDVIVDLQPVQVFALEEQNQILRLFAWLNLGWRDENIYWDPAEWGGVDHIVLPIKKLWTPDIVVRNSAENVRGEILDEDRIGRASVYSNGTVYFSAAGLVSTSCAVNMKYFPFDDQVCMIHMDSWTYTGDQVRLWNASTEMDLSEYKESGTWDLLDTEIKWASTDYGGTLFYEMKFFVYLRRQPLYFVNSLVIPSGLLSLLLILVFLLPAEAGEKVSLAITLFLSFSVFELLIADSMPKTSVAVPLLGVYILCAMVLAALSLLATVLVLAIHHQDPLRPVPKCLKTLTVGLGKVVCFRESLDAHDNAEAPKHRKSAAANETGGLNNGIFTLEENCNGKYDLESKLSNTPSGNDVLEQLRVIAGDLRALRSRLAQEEGVTQLGEDWRHLAKVLDRIFLLLFLLTSAIIAIYMFGIFPVTRPERPTFASG